MKILAIDIETSPNVVYTWGLWDQNVGLNQIVSTSEIICFAAHWVGEPRKSMVFKSVYWDGRDSMLDTVWDLLDEADVVLHYNGQKFDIPHLNREFIEHGYMPPSPYQQVDLYLTARRVFKFQSNKLEHVTRQLGLEGKLKHEGFELWRACLAGDEAAWRKMERYNRRDVTLLEELYELLVPWIPSPPNRALTDGPGHRCPRCGSKKLQSRGVARTRQSEFQRYQCTVCKGWSRGTRRQRGVHVVGVPA